jgi:hypothetical protein
MMLWVLFHAHKYRFDPSTLRPIDPSTGSGQAEKLRAGGKAQGRRKGSGQAERLRAGGKTQDKRIISPFILSLSKGYSS